jgi:hypothetical protein
VDNGGADGIAGGSGGGARSNNGTETGGAGTANQGYAGGNYTVDRLVAVAVAVEQMQLVLHQRKQGHLVVQVVLV